MFINNNARFCYQSKEKVLSSNTFWRMQIKMENFIDDNLEKSSSDESDNDSNEEIEYDNEKDNDEFNE